MRAKEDKPQVDTNYWFVSTLLKILRNFFSGFKKFEKEWVQKSHSVLKGTVHQNRFK
jgi:hypothetical protein